MRSQAELGTEGRRRRDKVTARPLNSRQATPRPRLAVQSRPLPISLARGAALVIDMRKMLHKALQPAQEQMRRGTSKRSRAKPA